MVRDVAGWLLTGFFLLVITPGIQAQTDSEVDTPTLTLQQAYKTALEQNEDLEAARYDRDVARETVTQTRSQYYPELTARAETYEQKDHGTGYDDETVWGADLNQPLYQGGRLWYGVDRAEHRREGVSLGYLRTQQQVLLRVADRYYRVLLAERSQRIAENALERARSQLKQAQARYEVGQVTQSSVFRAEVDVSEARQQKVEAENDARVAREELAVELGQKAIRSDLSQPSNPLTGDTDPESLVQTAYKNRRDLQQSKRLVEASRANVQVEQSDYYPSLSLNGSYNNSNRDAYGNFGNGSSSEDWRMTLQLEYPLFSGWKETSDVDEAEYNQSIQETNHQRLRREIRRDVRQAHSEMVTRETIVDTLETQVQSARENYREVSARYEEGLADAVDVSDAITTLNESELRRASARNDLRLARLQLKLAAGTFAQSYLPEGPQP